MNRYILNAPIHLSIRTVLALLPLLGASVAAEAQESPSSVATYAPQQTRVAILPVINQGGEKDAKQRAEQTKRGGEELIHQFKSRGFRLVDEADIVQVCQDKDIDLQDEEQHKRATYYQIGQAVDADLVVFAVITHVDQRRVLANTSGSQKLEGRASVKIWLLDVKRERPILNGATWQAGSSRSMFAEFDSGARHIRNAIGGAMKDVLAGFLKPYLRLKEAKSVSKQNASIQPGDDRGYSR